MPVSGSVTPAQPSSSVTTPGSEIVSAWSKVEIVVAVAVAATALVVILTVLPPAAVIVIGAVRRKRNNGNVDNCPRATSNVGNPVYGSKPRGACIWIQL